MFEGDIPSKEEKLIKAFVLRYGEEIIKNVGNTAVFYIRTT